MCNSDRRHFLRLSVLAVGAAGLAGAALAAEAEKPRAVYVCPPCGCAADGKEFPAPGTCPECGMPLIEKTPAPKRSSL
ncbi:MAG TPA: heavy metal-binding domain-containing protein [Phenylobacterium sp.]|jgi:rubrerythrin|uniref:heavy metal-binding domain-containing protein n=1 Tax=Phenylobacterium sp. TaxID=1871053 RepID=UPI002C453FB2|nr:heavy metal-binding domain-containing protein [Phenylobacterium sp.]HXA38005.1 heavy metal-binding domain-containing protein [Phenylobacterium sp.]